VARRAGRLADAETALRAQVAGTDVNAAAWNELGLTLRAEGKFADARSAYQSALQLDPNNAAAHRNLAVLLDLYLNDPIGALAEFERYRDLSGEDKPVSTWIAELRQRTGVKPTPPPADKGGAS